MTLNDLDWLFHVKFCFRAGLAFSDSANSEKIIACVKSNKDRRVLLAAPIFGGDFVSGDRLCPLLRKNGAF